jgi:hypothetical protein
MLYWEKDVLKLMQAIEKGQTGHDGKLKVSTSFWRKTG